ncbi:hypothetical protein [Polaribacter sp. KT 15]|uniref:hypothetical protein n=1 Tax=Polaribacter sp. KT 15 TaxID=1896175 RepID=UPI00090CC07D|nr:hypothetical protein [Polaribacter sp. KT 15]SHM83445.1 hypothetical protein SAMN05720268_0849 [Polaribacter sp. KT 15]
MAVKFRKEKISIQNIGKQRFWIGIILGLFSAIIISLTFSYFRELFRFFTTLSADLLILEKSELQFYNYFFSSLATILGLSITVAIWMTNNNHKRRKDKIHKQLSRTNIYFTFWLILMMIARFGSVLPFILYGMPGYDNQLNLFEEYWLLFVLIPIVVFAQNWFIVRLVYHSAKWIFYSILICVAITFTLKTTTSINQEILNRAYYKKFESDYNYIDQQINKAKVEYGIDFKENTLETLKKWKTESSTKQVVNLKSAFSKDKKVSLDTIILQKIVIKNFKENGRYFRRNSIDNWRYAFPKDILRQLELYDIKSNESKELIEILKEQIYLINTPEIDWKEYDKHTDTEIRKSFGVKYNVPKQIIEQLEKVRDSLINDNKYYEISKDLPELKQRNE